MSHESSQRWALIQPKGLYLCRNCRQCQLFTPLELHLNQFIGHNNKNRSSVGKIIPMYKKSKMGKSASYIYMNRPLLESYSWHSESAFGDLAGHKFYFPLVNMSWDDRKYGTEYWTQEITSMVFFNYSYVIKLTAYHLRDKCFKEKGNWYYLNSLPVVNLEEGPQYDQFLTTGSKQYRFVTCSKDQTVISFKILYSAFDDILWVCILLWYFAAIVLVTQWIAAINGKFMIRIVTSQTNSS